MATSYLLMSCLFHHAGVLWALGYPDVIPTHIAQIRQRAQDTPYDQSWALWFAASLHAQRGERDLAHTRLDQLMPLATEHDIAALRQFGMSLLGYVLVREGRDETGLALLRQVLASHAARGPVRIVALLYLARAYLHVHQPADGLRVQAEAFALIVESGHHHLASELHHLKGQLLLTQATPDTSQAETCFRQALAIARHQQAKSWELRAATSLARLWQQQGKRQQAYDLLAPVYHWFTEGFDTADLTEARALLDDLA
jgi:tetratricopeptide (TPR) repeat protein